MHDAWAPSPSPIALFLLGLEEQGADGSIDVGGRNVRLARGRVCRVSGHGDDATLLDFLRDSGRLDGVGYLRLSSAGETPSPENTNLSHEAWAEALRALYLERLVRGMARADEEGQPLPSLHPEGQDATPHDASLGLLALTLDALSRRASNGDAEQVGKRSGHVLEWLDGPHTARAKRWSRLATSGGGARVAELLSADPAAAPKIAALVRAGLARVVPAGSAVPAPERRMHSLPPGRTQGSSLPPGRGTVSLLPRRDAEVLLSPGTAKAFRDLPELGETLPSFPPALAVLEDPLDPLEREIAKLEQSGAPAPERARAWRALGEAWLDRYASIAERSRAFREAAAALPSDPSSLWAAADACAALARTDVALAYARAAIAASGAEDSAARRDALTHYALLCRRNGRVQDALSALKAARAIEGDGEPHALTASILVAQGRSADASEELLEGALRDASAEPARAAFSRAWAYRLAPASADAASAWAASLGAMGLHEGASAVRAEAARRVDDSAARLRLLLEAAEAAELEARPLTAAELLLRALDDAPELEVLYEPLAADLEAAGLVVERAVVLEELAHVCPDEARADWLTRAADARLEVPGDGGLELELRMRCLEVSPENPAARAAVQQAAEASGDPMIVADALERAAHAPRWRSAAARVEALEELADLSEQELGQPLRAAWARSVAAALGGEPLARAKQRHEGLVRQAMAKAAELDRRLQPAQGAERTAIAAELAGILAQDPERRERAVLLLREALELTWDDAAADVLERIHRLRRDPEGLAAFLRLRVTHDTRRIDKVKRLLRLSSLELSRDDHAAAAAAARAALDEVPGHREAMVRLRRAASRAGDDALLADALAREARQPLPPRELGRALSSLARVAARSGDTEAARDAAIKALEHDPHAGEAALFLLRALSTGARLSVETLARIRALFGDAPALLLAEVRSAKDAERRERAEHWARLSRSAPDAWLAMLGCARSDSATEDALSAIEELLRGARTDSSHARLVETALTELADSSIERATTLALQAADRFGAAGEGLRQLASALAPRTGEGHFETAALERRLAGLEPDARVGVLREIAALHERRGDVAGEARALLRLLARAPRDDAAITRLAWTYASTGEDERLMATLALRLSDGADETEHTTGLLALAAASASVLGDVDRAVAFLRAPVPGQFGISEEGDARRTLAFERLAMALADLGAPDDAIARLREASAQAPPKRAAAMLERASMIAAWRTGNLPLALELLVEGLERRPGDGRLLLAYEQLALEVGDIEGAEATYQRLIERSMGAHGRQAVLYRRARWLERAGAATHALTAYLEAAKHTASPGVVLTAIERLARDTGQIESLAEGLSSLADNAPHPMIRLGLMQRAATLYEQELARPEKAFELLFPTWKKTGISDLEEMLGRVAAAVRESDPAAGEACFERILAEILEKAGDAWMGDEKARLLRKAARVHSQARGDDAAAEKLLREALQALRADSAEPEPIAATLRELAALVRRDPARVEEAEGLDQEAATLEAEAQAAGGLGDESQSFADLGDESADDDAQDARAPDAQREPESPASVGADTEEAQRPSPARPSPASVEPDAFGYDAPAPDSVILDSEALAGLAADTTRRPLRSPTPAYGTLPSEATRSSTAAKDVAAPRRERSATPAPQPIATLEPDSQSPRDTLPEPEERASRIDMWRPADAPHRRASVPPIALPVTEGDAAEGDAAEAHDAEADALLVSARAASGARRCELLRAALLQQPWRVDVIRELRHAAEGAGRSGDLRVARAVLSLIEGDEDEEVALDVGALAASREALFRAPEFAGAQRALALVWDAALPLFRVSLRDFDVLGTDRVWPHSPNHLGRALSRATEVLPDHQVPVFASRGNDVAIEVVRTHPPSVLVGSNAPLTDERALRFELGRAIELARPENVLVSTLDATEGAALVAALRAAFGPADGGPVDREAAAMASRLWATIPPRQQREATELVTLAEHELGDYASLRSSVFAGAARAGLVASGSVTVALRTAAGSDADFRGEESFTQRVRGDQILSDLLRLAFGDAMVDAAS